ncbi:MAG: energy transducer TonB [Lentimonas sp.]
MFSTVNSPDTDGGKKRLLISPMLRVALLIGVLVHLAGFLIFRIESNKLPTSDTSVSFVQFISADSIASDRALEEQAQLFDSAPLFIPTEWNAAQSGSFVPRERALERFPRYEPEINLSAALYATDLPAGDQKTVTKPMDLLQSRFWVFFDGLAQSPQDIELFPTAGHHAEIFVLGQDRSAFSLESPLVFTDTSAVPEPVQLYFRVSATGRSIGDAVIAQSSGNAAFDSAVQAWLRRPETIGQLPVGYLSVTVYP